MAYTRYRELYNIITHSKAFGESGTMDNSKINKGKFTPHNLKTILLGSQGVLCVYYTTNQSNTKLVKFHSFKNLAKNEEEFNKTLKSDKGMVDALVDGLKFSNIEEIIFCSEGFNNIDLEREYTKLVEFASKIDTINKSFKRLMGVGLLKGFLTQDFEKLTNTNRIINQLNSANLTIQKVASFEPERDEYGVLKHFELNSAEYQLDAKYDPNADAKTRDSESVRLSRWRYEELERGKRNFEKKKAEVEKQKQAEVEAKVAEAIKEKQEYIRQLLGQGFKLITNKEQIAGNTELFSKTISWLKEFCTEKQNQQTGYRYKTCEYNQNLLKSKGISDVKDANIFNPNIFSLDEDLRFRLFVKENDLSFTILIKLPMDLDEFDFNIKGNLLNNICAHYSNRDRSKGKVYQSSILERPRIKGISTYSIDTIYNCVEIVLVKDLMDFKKSNWGFLEYLRACNGEQNEYSAFGKLPLGNKIVVGVKPNALKIDNFNCSGKQQTSGLICGAAGSGKSALIDNLVVQFLALKGNYGNGAVVLMDAKQELPALWRPSFAKLGVPFYSFDGGLIKDQESIKQQVKKNGKELITGFNQPITQEVGGMIFISTVYEVIQHILKKSGYKDINEFNKANVNIDGITRLPRIAIIIDEMNTFSINTKGDAVAKGIIDKITGGANLTRTSGFMWFLCGQDIPKSIVSAEKRGSFKYNIFGAMDSERYEYFGVTENEDVKKYEAKYGTSDNPRPIMSQGSFYAGEKGKTELIRSMFLADDQKDEALALLNSNFEGMFEFDKIVKYGLANNLFDNYTYGVGNKNNIIYAVLRDIGIISDAEFETATARLFNLQQGSVDGYIADEEEIDLFGDTPPSNPGPQGSQGNQQPIYQQPTPQPLPKQPIPQSTRIVNQHTEIGVNQPPKIPKNAVVYNDLLVVNNNPFINRNPNGPMSTINAVRDMTAVMLKDIERVIGDYSLISKFKIIGEGILVFNDVVYKPTFEEVFIKSLPVIIQAKIEQGNLVEFFDLRTIYKFKNLNSLIIESDYIAQGRARKELGIGYRKEYSVLFKQFKHLMYIAVGRCEYDKNLPDDIVKDNNVLPKRGFLSSLFAPKTPSHIVHKGDSLMDKVWDSKPVKVLGNAAGWATASYLVYGAAVMLGPVGLLFGAFAMAGAYKELKPKPTPQANQPQQKQKVKQIKQAKTKPNNSKQQQYKPAKGATDALTGGTWRRK